MVKTSDRNFNKGVLYRIASKQGSGRLKMIQYFSVSSIRDSQAFILWKGQDMPKLDSLRQ